MYSREGRFIVFTLSCEDTKVCSQWTQPLAMSHWSREEVGEKERVNHGGCLFPVFRSCGDLDTVSIGSRCGYLYIIPMGSRCRYLDKIAVRIILHCFDWIAAWLPVHSPGRIQVWIYG